MDTRKVSAYAARLVAYCLDARSVWLIEHGLLLFADERTLERLRKTDDLYCAGIDVLVVIDGDRFENVWGPCKLSGSLARWAWQQVTPEEAYYDESRWADADGQAGRVVRVRRKASLLWRASEALAA
jgi:hypothetical protein